MTGEPGGARVSVRYAGGVTIPQGRASRRVRWRPALLAAAAGLALAASTPPVDVDAGVLVGLCLFGCAVAGAGRGGAGVGFSFGFVANLVALRFVPDVMARFTPLPAPAGWLSLVLLAAMQAVPWAIAGALARWLSRPRPGGAAPAWPGWLAFGTGVYVATSLPAVFPWTPAGGLGRWPILLQAAELVGERGVSFLLAVACGLAADATTRAGRSVARRAALLALSAGMFALLTSYGALRMRAIDAARASAPRARVALLDPDFDAMFRWEEGRAGAMMDRLSALTRRAEAEGAALTVWPESAYPYTLAHGTRASPRGARAVLQRGVRGPVLTGAYLAKGAGLGTNSALLVAPSGEIGPSYDKRHLLWFGEAVPFADALPFLRRVFARGAGLVPGTESVLMTTGPVSLAVLNCYEDTLPAAGREAMAVRPNVLVNITNDAWFVGSAEGELHLRLATLRAIETRRDLLRAVNRGPTSWVDAAGRVERRLEPAPGLGPPPPLLADAALLDAPPTLYVRAGDAPLAGTLALAFVAPWAWRRRRGGGART